MFIGLGSESTPTTSRFKDGGEGSRYVGQEFPLKEEGFGGRFNP